MLMVSGGNFGVNTTWLGGCRVWSVAAEDGGVVPAY